MSAPFFMEFHIDFNNPVLSKFRSVSISLLKLNLMHHNSKFFFPY